MPQRQGEWQNSGGEADGAGHACCAGTRRLLTTSHAEGLKTLARLATPPCTGAGAGMGDGSDRDKVRMSCVPQPQAGEWRPRRVWELCD